MRTPLAPRAFGAITDVTFAAAATPAHLPHPRVPRGISLGNPGSGTTITPPAWPVF